MDRLLNDTTRIDKRFDRTPLLGQQEGILPDGSSTIDTSDVDHSGIVIVASPDTHNIVRGIAKRPVITKIIRRAPGQYCMAA